MPSLWCAQFKNGRPHQPPWDLITQPDPITNLNPNPDPNTHPNRHFEHRQWAFQTDGSIYAQPLVVPNQPDSAGSLIVATLANSIYSFYLTGKGLGLGLVRAVKLRAKGRVRPRISAADTDSLYLRSSELQDVGSRFRAVTDEEEEFTIPLVFCGLCLVPCPRREHGEAAVDQELRCAFRARVRDR